MGRLARFSVLVSLISIAMILLCNPDFYGQVVTGIIVGVVTDTSGSVVPQARVTVTNTDTGVTRTLATDAGGTYTVPDLSPGSYKVAAERDGFTTGVHTGITLSAAATVRVDISLQPGAVTQTVTVNDTTASTLQTDSADVGRTLTAAAVEQLPLSTGHNFQNLLSLVPGGEVAQRQHSSFYNPQNSMSSPTNGVPSRANTFNIDGINDNERSDLLQPYIVPMEAIQEVAVTSSNYDASQGTALGAVVNVIVKSGTNSFHGEAYEFYTGNALDSRSYFEQGANGAPFKFPHSVDNYWGANLGGPIRKDKTFFFISYTSHPQHTGNFGTYSVPTAAMRNGDFSDPALPTIYNPASGDTLDCLPNGNPSLCGTGRTPFPGNIIPPSLLNPVAESLLSHVLLPNTNQNASGLLKYQNNLLYSTLFIQNVYDITFKIDQHFGEKDHLSGRFSYTNPKLNQPGIFGIWGGPAGAGAIAGYEGTGYKSTYSVGTNWEHVFSPTFLSEARIGVNRYFNAALPVGYGQDLATQSGIPGANTNAFSSGSVDINGEGFSDPLIGTADSYPWYHGQTIIIATNKWSKIWNKHTLSLGFEYYRVRDDYLLGADPMGEFGFSAGTTSLNGGTAGNFANAFASMLLDVPSSAMRGYDNVFPTYRQNEFFPYVSDTWQVTPKLTANLGLRWEYYGPPTPRRAGGFSNYNPSKNQLELAGIGSIPRDSGLAADYDNFGPRIGLAYRLTNLTVLRAGFGITVMSYPIDTWDYNYPIEPTQSFSSLGSFGPAILSTQAPATFEQGFPALPPYVPPSSGVISASTPALINQSYYYLPLNWRNPYLMSWNLAYQRELPGQWVVDVAYVGNRGVHSPVEYNLNAATVYGKGASGQPEYATFGRTASTTMYFAMMRSAYDSLQIKFDHRFARDFAVTTSYTYSKALGQASENSDYPNGIQDYVNLKINYAKTDFNQTHIFSQSLLWTLPLGAGKRFVNRGVTSKIVGGWNLDGDWIFHTGTPLEFSCTCPAFNTPGNHAFPNVNGPIRVLHGIQNQPWFDTSVFSVPAAGTQGNVSPYIMSGPAFFNMDASLMRRIRLTERFNLEFRSEWLHATNTPQFSNPNTTLGNPSFGLVTAATGGRIIDLAIKLTF